MGIFGKKKQAENEAQKLVETQIQQANAQKKQQKQEVQKEARVDDQKVDISGAIYNMTGEKIGGVGSMVVSDANVLVIFDNQNNYVGGIYKDADHNDKASLLDSKHKRRAYYRGGLYNFTVLTDTNQSIDGANALFSIAFTLYTGVAVFVKDSVFELPVVVHFFSTFPKTSV